MPVLSMYIEETGKSGDANRVTHDFILMCQGMNDDAIYSWLNDDHATLSMPVERHDGVLITSGHPIARTFGGIELQNTSYELVRDGDPEIYRVKAEYGSDSPGNSSRKPNAPDNTSTTPTITYGFEYALEVDHFYTSLETVGLYPTDDLPLTPAPNHKRAINVQADGSVEGVQIPDPGQVVTITLEGYPTFFTPAVRKKLSDLRGQVNDTDLTILGVTHAAGEARYLGANGQISNDADTQSSIDLRFGIIKNEINKTTAGIDAKQGLNEGGGFIANAAAGIIKEGWDYFWIYYGKSTDAAGKTIKKPRGAYVERLFERTDLNALFTV